ncbi:MAG: methyltransferase domain-containing protein [Sandaracinaceae bacterium]|nr:methyltransferase domain-containing protein [Sandaracinaceae bacterium]
MSDEAELHPLLERVLRARIGFAPQPWPKALRRTLARLAAERDVTPHALLRRCDAAQEPEAVQALIGAATIPHTHFFRHPAQLERLGRELSALQRPARIWSAGCATGEEPYSLALLAQTRGVPVQILATDVNEEVLDVARAAVYPAKAVRRAGIDAPGAGEWRVPEAVRASVRFENASIAGSRPELGEGPFDFVFCRNVLIYFDAVEGSRMVERLLRQVRPGGGLVLAPVEVLRPLPSGVHRGEPLGWIQHEPAVPAPAPPPPPAAPPPSFAPEADPDALTVAARAFGQGALDEAERELRGLIDRHPSHAVAWFLLGEVLMKRGERTQAAVAFTRSSEHASSDEEGRTLSRAASRRRLSIDDDSEPS